MWRAGAGDELRMHRRAAGGGGGGCYKFRGSFLGPKLTFAGGGGGEAKRSSGVVDDAFAKRQGWVGRYL